jgi:hypothetical protein
MNEYAIRSGSADRCRATSTMLDGAELGMVIPPVIGAAPGQPVWKSDFHGPAFSRLVLVVKRPME